MVFGVWDYLVFIATLVLSVAIGVYARFTGGRQKTSEEYLMADHSMPIWPVAFSLMASFMSAISLMGLSNESYQFGTQFVVVNIGYFLATPICAYLFWPVFYNMNVTSVYEYLDKRFGLLTRLLVSIAGSLYVILYMGIVLFAPALALETVTGIPKVTAIVIVGIVGTFYSTIGGLRAVLLTDAFQTILMFAGVFTIIISGLVKAGGLTEIIEAASEGGRLEFWNFNPDPTVRHTWLSLIIGGFGIFISGYAVNQASVQRLMSVKTLRDGQMSLWWQYPLMAMISLTTLFAGLVIYWNYKDCDPLLSGRISSRDQIMPIYIIDELGQYPGVSGVCVAGIFAASLSTISTALNSLSAVTLEDYFKIIYLKFKGKPFVASKNSSAMPSKILSAVYGIICVGVAIALQNLAGVLQASLTLLGVIGGPSLAVFTLGMFTKVANQVGVIVGLFCGMGITTWSRLGGPRPSPIHLSFSTSNCSAFGGINVPESFDVQIVRDDSSYFYLYRISYMYVVAIGFFITLIVGYVTSYVLYLMELQGMEKIYLKDSLNEIDTTLFSPPIARRIQRDFKGKQIISNEIIKPEE